MAKRKVRAKARAKKTVARKPTAKQALRKSIQRKVDKKITGAVKLARDLGGQNLSPDEVAARVKAHLAGIGDDVADDLMKLAGPILFVRS